MAIIVSDSSRGGGSPGDGAASHDQRRPHPNPLQASPQAVSVAVTRLGADGSAPTAGAPEATTDTKSGVVLLFIVASLFFLAVLPVVVRGAPVRDDFDVCLSPRWTSGAERMLFELWPEWGAVRLLGRFIEQSIIADLCGAVPFGTIIFIPLLTTVAAGFVLRALLYDLEVPTPWPKSERPYGSSNRSVPKRHYGRSPCTSRWGYSSRWSRCVCMYAVAWRSRPCWA
jgi:hypothetical protein